MNCRRIAEQIAGLPLARVTADEAVEVIEAHADRPIIKGARGVRLPGRHIVVLAEPRGGVTVRLQSRGDSGGFSRDDGIVAWEATRHFGDIAVADRVVI